MVDVALCRIDPTPIAVAKREVRQAEIGTVMVSALDAVWSFVRSRGLDAGHNVAIYGPGVDDGSVVPSGDVTVAQSVGSRAPALAGDGSGRAE